MTAEIPIDIETWKKVICEAASYLPQTPYPAIVVPDCLQVFFL